MKQVKMEKEIEVLFQKLLEEDEFELLKKAVESKGAFREGG